MQKFQTYVGMCLFRNLFYGKIATYMENNKSSGQGNMGKSSRVSWRHNAEIEDFLHAILQWITEGVKKR